MAEEDRARRQSDMILGPNEYALIRDDTKGDISVFVGPNKTSLAGTDSPVIFDERTKRFRGVHLDEAVQTVRTAPEGFYITLKNPASDGAKGKEHPQGTGKQTTPDLMVGRKINVPGPCSFALWPGQMAKVVAGHTLRSNEYLVVRVYDEAAARSNWKNAVVKGAVSVDDNSDNVPVNETKSKKSTQSANTKVTEQQKFGIVQVDPDTLVMGQQLIICGTEASFYIPPTGVEVVAEQGKDGQLRHVREAVTLERLEYAILLDQNGNKRYEMGPSVVFPRPTEKFVEKPIKSDPEKAKAKKFRVVELGENTGIYIKVIAPYTESRNGHTYEVGEELFITGKEQKIYFPRDEHAVIKYGEQELTYGVAIPRGEARYVLDRNKGDITLATGPAVFLPDPRKEVIVRRVLSDRLCLLMYPGNSDALEYNRQLAKDGTADLDSGSGSEHISDRNLIGAAGVYTNSYGAAAAVATPEMDKRVQIRGASKALGGDSFDRKNKFTAPRAITLNTKFDGAVSINIYTGYAVMLVTKSGDKRVVQGPQQVLLEFDESPQIIHMSRGKPKGSAQPPMETVYLKTANNRIGDILDVETADFVKLKVQLSYRLNFTGADPAKWFEVDDYVKFFCDNMRSRIRAEVRKLDIRSFYAGSETFLRDIILGKNEGVGRVGTLFAENNLHVYDVEVLDVTIVDPGVQKLLSNVQRAELEQTIQLDMEARRLELMKQSEDIKRETSQTVFETEKVAHQIGLGKLLLKAELDKQTNVVESEKALMKTEVSLFYAESETKIASEKQKVEEASKNLALAFRQRDLDLTLQQLVAETTAATEKGKAFTPQLIAALQSIGDTSSIEKIATALGPLEILGINKGEGGVVGALTKLLGDSPLGRRLLKTTDVKSGNGSTATSQS